MLFGRLVQRPIRPIAERTGAPRAGRYLGMDPLKKVKVSAAVLEKLQRATPPADEAVY
jgi:hypothetical protein